MAEDQPTGATGASDGLSKEELRRRATIAKQLSSAFGEIVTLLMRSEAERQRSLADLEWMIVPALMAGQFAIAEAQSKETGAVAPMAAVLWAMVSEDVDRRLAAELDKPVRLQPSEWRSGDIPWVIAALGEPNTTGQLLGQLSKTVFKERPAKLRTRGPDGKAFIGRLEVDPVRPS
ncbi:MAG: toxin-activating lysine-acyltransferase [Deltaproteobacteria bacterium]